MAAFVRDKMRVFNVQKFIKAFFPTSGSTENTLYLGIGRPYAWNAQDVPPASSVTHKNLESEINDWEDLMSMKKVTASNVSHAVKNYAWTPNTIYDIYRHDYGSVKTISDRGHPTNTLADAFYYVVAADNSVWICIKQPKVWTSATTSVISSSTKTPIDPTTVQLPGSVASAGLFQTSDGYIWKKIAVTDSADVVAFQSNDFHPVRTLASAVLTGTYAQQWTLQINSASHRSGIYNIEVTNRGSGYVSGQTITKVITDASNGFEEGGATPYVKVLGDGQGLTYRVDYVGGQVNAITVLNPGSGYTFASVEFVGGSGAAAVPILTPHTGLGVDPVKDLDAFFLSIFTELDGSEFGNFTTNNDYRKISLVVNPKISGSFTALYSDTYADVMYRAVTTNVETFAPDDAIEFDNGVKATVVDYDPAPLSKVLRMVLTKEAYSGSFVGADNIIYDATQIVKLNGATVAISLDSVDTNYPQVQIGSGDIIYSEYRQSVSRGPSVTEQWKIVLEF